jgi:hypothetical protein
MVRIVNGEKLPGARATALAGFAVVRSIRPVQSVSHHSGDIFRRAVEEPDGTPAGLGDRGALTALIAWFMVGSMLAAVIAGVIASLFVLISDGFTSAGPGPSGAALAVGPEAPAAHGPAAAVRAAAAASVAAAAALAAAVHRGAGSMSIRRIGRHLLEHRWRLRRIFRRRRWRGSSRRSRQARPPIPDRCVSWWKARSTARRCFAISPRGSGRWISFSQLRIWDTVHNNGVLIYLLLADHDFEIVADRGIDSQRRPRRLGKNLRRDGSAVQGRRF